MQRQLCLVAYDIASSSRLRRALRVVREYALGGQKSVHECFLNEAEQRELHRHLQAIVDGQTDRYLILRLDPRCRVRTLGRGSAPADPGWFYLG